MAPLARALAALELLLLAAAQAGPWDAQLVLLAPERVAQFGARCLDGSPPGFYIRRSLSPAAATRWKIHLAGGGWCTNGPDCLGRSRSLIGGSGKWPPWLSELFFPGFGEAAAFSGLMDANTTNPFGSWNFAWFCYCDGSSWLADVSSPVAVGNETIYLRGRAILDALLAELEVREHMLSTATEVLLSGTSAGGLAAFLHGSYVRSRLAAPGARLVSVPDAGYFMDHAAMGGRGHAWLASLRTATAFWNATLRGDAANCAAAYADDVARCLCPNILMPFSSSVPHFIVQSFMDPTNWAICFSPICDIDSTCNATEVQELLGYAADLRASVLDSVALFGARDGLFLTSCAQHEESCAALDYYGIEIAGPDGAPKQNINSTLWAWYGGADPAAARRADAPSPARDASCAPPGVHHGVCSSSPATPAFALTPWGRDSVRVQVMAPGNALQDPPLMALLETGPPPSGPADVTRSANGLSLTNGNLVVALDAATMLLTATRVSDGRLLLRQTALVFGEPDVAVSRPSSASVVASFAGTASGERIYGLGEHRTGAVQLAPFARRFADSQDYALSHGADVIIPFYSSSQGYGALWNSASLGSVAVGPAGIEWRANATPGLDIWLTTTSADFDPVNGTSPFALLLHNFADAVGHAPPMPAFASGFWQSKDRYRNQSQLLDVARGHAERGLPLAALVIDWNHWIVRGDWRFDPACWPDPAGMVRQLRAQGVECMVTFWPLQQNGSAWFERFYSSGFFAKNVSTGAPALYNSWWGWLVDATLPGARAAAFSAFWEGYGQYGITNAWLDASEPQHFGAAGEGRWRLAAGTDGEVMSAWTREHARAFAEGFAARGLAPGAGFVLSRSAWPGSWRHGAALWSGDINSTFEELALQIKALQGAMMSGVVLWTTDIGGTAGNASDPVFQELLCRWLQFGAFNPIFRVHGHRAGGPPTDPICGDTNGDNEVYSVFDEASPEYAGVVAVMRLRESLRPYIMALNAEAVATGMPMARPLFLEFPLDPGCEGADVEDEFMLGSEWLVAPVYVYRAVSRSVYLPRLGAGEQWVNAFGGAAFGAGGVRVVVDTTNVTEFPLFRRESVR